MEKDIESIIEPTVRPTSLSKYEIACTTAGVPGTHDPYLNKIIEVGQRFRTAAELLGYLRSQIGETANYDEAALAKEAVKLANALMAEVFRD